MSLFRPGVPGTGLWLSPQSNGTSLPVAIGSEAVFPYLGGYISSWEEKNCRSAFQLLGYSYQLFWGRGTRLTTLSPEKRCQCQPLWSVIKADEKRAVDMFMSPEYSVWTFYGHRKPERQWHSYPFLESGEEQFLCSMERGFERESYYWGGHVKVSLIQKICGSTR